MDIRFYLDPDTGLPHIYGHGVTTEENAMSDQKFPPGWDEARIREVIEHYDSQDEDERAAEIEAAWEAEGMTLMSVPTELVPEIRALLARKQTA
ncbi:MAG: hypothetical protein WBX00_03070 [Isosphaeraceae bacterium]